VVVEVVFRGDPDTPRQVVRRRLVPSELGPYPMVLIRSCEEVNKPPTAHDQRVILQGDEPVVIELTGFDPEGAPLDFSIVTSPHKGALEPASTDGSTWIFTPDPDFEKDDAFTFEVSDGELLSPPATVTIERECKKKKDKDKDDCKSEGVARAGPGDRLDRTMGKPSKPFETPIGTMRDRANSEGR
jgi:hypothetical protein